MTFSRDQDVFWVSNPLESTISSYTFDNDGTIELLNQVEAAGTPPSEDDPFGTTDGWLDVSATDDGNFLYQLYGLDGTIGVFQIDGNELTLVEEVSGDLPEENTQGIVAIDFAAEDDGDDDEGDDDDDDNDDDDD